MKLNFYVMSKKLFIFGLILALSAAFTACSDDDGGKGSLASKEEILLKKYPKAANINWKKSNDKKYDIATFTLPKVTPRAMDSNVDTVSVWFGNNDNIRLVDQEISYSELPEAIRQSFEKTKCNPVKGISEQTLINTLYSDAQVWETDDVYKLERDGVVSYKIEMESVRNEVEIDLYYDVQGILLKEVEDDGDREEMPLEIPDAVKDWVARNHANAEIIDYESEKEDGVVEHELDLKEGKIIVEITLVEENGTLKLDEEEYNYPDINALPADIKTEVEKAIAAQSVVTAEDIEDIEMVKEEGAEIYTIEFEKGDDEYELKITRNSDQTITVGDIVLES
ncbi:MAG TPA: hypothetical protein DD657_07780 [Culturomica sp.]|nr:hypothetical protein [Culturomica sp.]